MNVLTNDSEAPLPIGTFLLLRDLIQVRLGVWYDETKRDLLAGKLSERLTARRMGSFLEYFFYLKYDAEAPAEWRVVSDLLSVQETYFYREFDQIRAFVDVLVPKHIHDQEGPLRVWSAACASGEEPLSLAIALTEAGWSQRIPIEIVGSDMSPAALEKAERGIYRERSFRALPERLRDKYFRTVAEGWQIDPAVKSRVSFQQANLLDSHDIAALAQARYIFCRNVFIYFSTATIAHVVNEFARQMPRPGYLFVGVSESLLRVSSPFELEQIDDAHLYVRR